MRLKAMATFGNLRSQMLMVALVWTIISLMIFLKSMVIGPIAGLSLASYKSELLAWSFLLAFVPLVVTVVNIKKIKAYWFATILINLIIAFLSSMLWDSLFVQDVGMVLPEEGISIASPVEGVSWSGAQGKFFQGSVFDIFSSYALLALVAYGINGLHKLRLREVNEVKLRELLAQSKIKLLKSQVHPHFMFNTLNTISGLMEQDVNKAQIVLEDFGFLLRSSLKQSSESEVPLSEELDFVKKYLAIEHVRFGDALHTRYEVNESDMGVSVPHMIIQPLVENSIKHGFMSRTGVYRLFIKAERTGDLFSVIVEDDGSGLRQDFQKGVGLEIIEERLRDLYGGDGRLSLEQIEPKGVRATVTVPYKHYQSKNVDII